MKGLFVPVRIIVLTLLIFVLVANISLFIITQNGLVGNNYEYFVGSGIFNTKTLQFAHYRYRGFYDFFEFMSTFPCLNMSLSTLNEVASILSGQIKYMPDSLIVLDWIIKFVKIVFLPVSLLL